MVCSPFLLVRRVLTIAPELTLEGFQAPMRPQNCVVQPSKNNQSPMLPASRQLEYTSDQASHGQSLDADSIFLLFESCVERYRSLLSAIQRKSQYNVYLRDLLKSEALDELSRLYIWGQQTCAVLPQNSRHSLDQRLRKDGDTQKVVIRSLRRLCNHIDRGQAKKAYRYLAYS